MNLYCYAFYKLVSYILATITMYVLCHRRGQIMNTNKIKASRRHFLFHGILHQEIHKDSFSPVFHSVITKVHMVFIFGKSTVFSARIFSVTYVTSMYSILTLNYGTYIYVYAIWHYCIFIQKKNTRGPAIAANLCCQLWLPTCLCCQLMLPTYAANQRCQLSQDSNPGLLLYSQVVIFIFPMLEKKMHNYQKEIYISNMNFINPVLNFKNEIRKIKNKGHS